MAEKTIKMRKPLAAALLPVPLELEKKKKKLQQQARAFLPPLPPVLLVSLWGLFNAGAVLLTFAAVYTLVVINPCVPSWMVPPAEVMDSPTRAEDDARASVLVLGMVWCAVAQAAAAAPALLAPASHRQIRRALAYVILAAAMGSHCLFASAVGGDVFRAAPPTSSPEYATYHVVGRIINSVGMFIMAMGDVVGFMALLVGIE